jgi:hypothetical protein
MNTFPSAAHRDGCGCAACASQVHSPAAYPHWKTRRRQRIQREQAPAAAAASCACAHSRRQSTAQELEDAHVYWRRRRQLRHGWTAAELELLGEAPIFQLVGAGREPVSAVPVLQREFEARPITETAAKTGQTGSARIVYVYFGPAERERLKTMWRARRDQHPGNPRWQGRISSIIQGIDNCGSPRHWRQSEEDVIRQYKRKFPRSGVQLSYAGGVQQPGRAVASTVPDITLALRARGAGMHLPSRRELELIEVKRYKLDNVPRMLGRLSQQIVDRSRIDKRGRHQSVVLDFRGQESRCVEIPDAAKKVAERLHRDAPDVKLLVQVLLWSGCPVTCSLRGTTLKAL